MQGLKEAADFLKKKDDFTVVCHYDADGLTAGALIGTVLKRLGKKFAIHSTRALDTQRLRGIREKGNTFVFVDLGSGQTRLLEKELGDKEYCIIDHHKPDAVTERPHFNPHLFGADGSSELSGAGAAYFVGREVSKKNTDLSKIAIIGAVGDMQDTGGALTGLNREILKDGEECGEVAMKKDLRLFGRNSRPLTQFLSYCAEPFFPGLTANEEACREFMHSLDIPLKKAETWLYYVDLSENEKKTFVSGLYVYGKQHNIPEESLRDLVGEVYEFPREPERTELRDAKEFATMLNACGRNDQPDIGIQVCMGDRGEYLDKARTLLQRHRKVLRDGISWAQQTGAQELENIYVLDAGREIKDTLIGVIAGMLYGAQVIRNDKPIIALAVDDEGMDKASGRGTWTLVRRGLDLGAAMREAAKAAEGEGGGHTIAAGARVAPGKKKLFIEKIDEIIGGQLKKK
jgi:RecJ-like exonuclease